MHCASLSLSGAVEVRKEGLEAQINRLAELIGRLENKVRGSSYNTERSSASSLEASYNSKRSKSTDLCRCNPVY